MKENTSIENRENLAAEQSTAQTTAQPTAQPTAHVSSKNVRVEKPFPGIGDLLAIIGIYLLSTVAAMMASLFFRGLDSAPMTPRELGANSAITAVILYVISTISIVLYKRLRGGRAPLCRLSTRGLNPNILIGGIVLILSINVLIAPLLALLPEIDNSSLGRGVWCMVALVIMAPLFEEFICRGVILESVRARYGAIAGLVASSLIFGVIHMHPTAVVNATIMGFVLGSIYLVTNSLYSSIILHMVQNGVAYVLMVLGMDDATFEQMVPNPTWRTVFYVCAAVITLLSVAYIWVEIRKIKRLEAEKIEQSAINHD